MSTLHDWRFAQRFAARTATVSAGTATDLRTAATRSRNRDSFATLGVRISMTGEPTRPHATSHNRRT